jgi:hypothetical protein
MAGGADFAVVAERLRAILEANADGLTLTAYPNGAVKLERPPATAPSDYVGGTRIGKTYVSYYLMPVYGLPALLADISPELRRRMQGKSCFNFTHVDETLFAELAALTATGSALFRDFRWPARSSR